MEREGRWEGMGVLEAERGVAGMGERMVMAWEARGVGAGKGVDQSVVVESVDGKINEKQSKSGGERISLGSGKNWKRSRSGRGWVESKASKGEGREGTRAEERSQSKRETYPSTLQRTRRRPPSPNRRCAS